MRVDQTGAGPERVAILGAGTIGLAWAVVFARAGLDVALHDPDAGRRGDALAGISDRLDDLAGFDLLDEAPETILARIRVPDQRDAALGDATWVQECAPEALDLKQTLFAELDGAVAPSTVLATSSSAIPVSRIVTDPAKRRRCLVVHPGNPPYLLPVAEIVPAPETDPDVVARAQALMNRAGMVPVVVKRDVEGFLFNRLQGAVLREAYCLVRDGVADVEDIDRVMREGLGLRWSVIGPFETVDLNTRGGIAAHADRMGPAYARMGRERGQDDPWTDDLVATVASQRRDRLPLDAWDDRAAWRDRMVMAMVAARRRAREDFGS